MYKIDKTDLKIINLLIGDGRIHAAEIARQMGNISERAVRYRIERMIENDVMQISAVVNPRSVGLSVVADVWIECDADAIMEVARRMTDLEEISYVACSIGERDVSVQVLARDTGDVYRFVTEVIAKVPGVRKTTTNIVPMVLKDIYQWRIPSGIVENNR
jgi:Lrp/AsnC family transcriptional regulator, regulator for asnA, asnC and gidA